MICLCNIDYTFEYLLNKLYIHPFLKGMYENTHEYPVYGMF